MRDPFIPLERQIGKRLPDRLVWQLRYLLHHRRWPNLDQPRDFNEKVIWRTLYDRRPIFVTASDKHASKQMALERCPWIRVPETIWKGRDVAELVGLDLPERWVLKPNNSTHRVVFGEGAVGAERARELAIETEGWADTPYQPNARAGTRQYWCEAAAENCLLVEEFVGEELGQLDFRGFVIGGELRTILVTWRVTEYPHGECSFYDPEFNLLPVSRKERAIALDRPVVPIPGFREAVEEVAAASGLDSTRVDLFYWGGELWFGEATVYPVDGLVQYWPRSFDFELGAYWPDQERLLDSANTEKA
jgi:hypothetical protein